jgi:hypothetical protein
MVWLDNYNVIFETQKVGDCDFFGCVDNEMTAYEKKLMEHLKDME